MTTWYAQSGGADIQSLSYNDASDGTGSPGTPVDGDTVDLYGELGVTATGTLQRDWTIQDGLGGSNLLISGTCVLGGNAAGLVVNVSLASSDGSSVLIQSAVSGVPVTLPGGALELAGLLSCDPTTPLSLAGGTWSMTGVLDVTACASWPITSGSVSNQGMILAPVGMTGVAAGLIYRVPTPSETSSGTAYGLAGTELTGTLASSNPANSDVRLGVANGGGTGTCHVPAAADVRRSTAVDATTGTCYVPAAADVRRGTNVDATTGTCYVAAAADVRSGTSTDATVGACHVPTAGQVLSGISVDATTGNVVLPIVSVVLAGVTFGPASADTGTLAVDNADIAACLTAINTVATNVSAIEAVTGALTRTGGKLWVLDGSGNAVASASDSSAIKAKTDNLPASPAAAGSQMDLVNAPNATAVTALQSGLGTHTDATTIEAAIGTLQTNLETHGDATWAPPSAATVAAAVGSIVIATPAVGAPPSSPTLVQVLGYQQAGLAGNGHADGNANTRDLRGPDGTVLCKATIAFVGGVYSQGQLGAP